MKKGEERIRQSKVCERKQSWNLLFIAKKYVIKLHMKEMSRLTARSICADCF